MTLTSGRLFAGGDLLVLDRVASGSVLRFDSTTGAFLDIFVPKGSGGLSYPNDITVGPDGNLYISQTPGADYTSATVLRYSGTTGAFMDVFVQPNSGNVNQAAAIRFGPDGNLYVADFNDGICCTATVKRFNGTTGAFIDVFTSGYGMVHPSGMTFGPDGNLYVGDELNIVRFNGTTGAFIDVFVPAGTDGLPVPPCGPSGDIVFGSDKNLYAAAPYCNTVVRYNGTTGAFMDFFVPSGTGVLSSPSGLKFGPDGALYVGVTSQVLRFDGTTGAFLGAFVPAGSGGLSVPGNFIFRASSTPHYSVCLLYDSTKAVHSGSTLPVKLELCDGSGNDLSSSTVIVHAVGITQISTSISGPVQDSGNANPDNDFRFDSTLGTIGGYIFNLNTNGFMTGTYNLNFMVTGDSFVYSAPVQVK